MVDRKWSQDMGETNGSKGEVAGPESHGMKSLEVEGRSEMFVRHIEHISNEIWIVRLQKSG